MADDKDYAVLQAMIEPLTQGVNAIATRPQKTYQSVTSTPYALADLEEARNQIGLSTKELNDVLKGREQLGYSLANTLANMPQQQGYGSWLTDFARGFGMGASAPANARMARQQQIYDAQMKDLANRLAFDKAMGETQVSRMGYTPMEYTGSGVRGSASGGKVASSQTVPFVSQADWDYWIKNWDKDSRPTEKSYREQSGLGRYLSNMGVGKTTASKEELPARQDYETFLGKNILMMARDTLKGTGPITDFEDRKYTQWISEAGKDPVAMKDTFVRIVQDVSKKNAWSDEQKRFAYEQLGLLSNTEDLLPAQIKQDPLRVKDLGQTPAQPQQQMPAVGEIRNGVRFLGYNPDGSMKFEKVAQ